MSKLQDLIQELCPNGVEYKKLGVVVVIKNGKDYKHLAQGHIPVYGSGGIMTYVNEYVYNKPTVLIPRKGSLGNLFYIDTPFWNVDTIFYTEIDTNQIIAKYLYYVLANEHLENLNKAGGVPSLTQSILNKVEIPVPPLPVQEEIVRILDHFTNLTAELQAELQARKEQYEYYKLTIFKLVNLHYKDCLLKEIATFSQGIQIDPKYQYDTMQPNRVRFLRIVDFVNENEPYRFIEKPNDKYIKSSDELIMIRYGASAAGKVFMCNSGAIANNMFKINLRPDILPKYVMYYLSQIPIYTLLNKSGGKSTMPAINFKLVGSIHISIPPLSIQQRIVSILDKFDTLVNDLSQGLPAEIAAVQEQYEYYRNELLSFPRNNISA